MKICLALDIFNLLFLIVSLLRIVYFFLVKMYIYINNTNIILIN